MVISPQIQISFLKELHQQNLQILSVILPDINRDGYDEIIISSFDQTLKLGIMSILSMGHQASDRLSGSTFDLSQADAIFSYSDTSTVINFGETVKGLEI